MPRIKKSRKVTAPRRKQQQIKPLTLPEPDASKVESLDTAPAKPQHVDVDGRQKVVLYMTPEVDAANAERFRSQLQTFIDFVPRGECRIIEHW